MPCHTDPPTQEEIYKWDAPAAACDAITLLFQHGLAMHLSHRTLSWWALHKKKDSARERQEAEQRALDKAQKSALAKLTSEEAEALGLKPRR